jgi:CRISPR-associated protein Cas1
MIGRIIEIQEDGRHLHLYRGFLLISVGNKEIARVPLGDISSVIINAYQISYSHNLLLELSNRNIVFVICGSNHLPTSILWPVEGNYQQNAVMKAQINASEPLNKQLWKQIIQAKLKFQQEVLDKAGIKGSPLLEMSKRVQSGDTGNLEAQGAKRYWTLLFGNKFIRDRQSRGINSMLNYGYAIIRSNVARSIIAAGMHPTFGIFHKNRFNSMCLVDDLMEPYRPLIDWEVYKLHKIGTKEITSEIKKILCLTLSHDCAFHSKDVPISAAINHTAQSLSLCFQGNIKNLSLPDKLLP